MSRKATSRIPSFRDDDEEREFWAKHSFEEFAEELEDVDIVIRPARTEQIAIRLYEDDLAALRGLARRRGVGHTTLARSVLEQWIAKSRPKVEASRQGSRHGR